MCSDSKFFVKCTSAGNSYYGNEFDKLTGFDLEAFGASMCARLVHGPA